MKKAPTQKTADKASKEKDKDNDNTKQRVLEAALDVFGRRGFDGASTRAIANAAGANIQSIPYYFGGKKGLYLAVAEYFAANVSERTREMREEVAQKLQQSKRGKKEKLDRAEAQRLLVAIGGKILSIMLAPEMEASSRFVLREQQEPTDAFDILYRRVIGPLFDMTRQLVAIMLDNPDPDDLYVRMRTFSLMGSIMVFRFGKATLRAQLKSGTPDAEAFKTFNRMIADSVASIGKTR